MSHGVNMVILVGNLGQDPDVKYTQSGVCICTLSVATTSSRKDRDGQYQDKTEWHRVKLLGKLGEIAGQYLTKGKQVYIEGRIEYGKYTAKDGTEKYTTDIIADEMQMLGGGGGGDRQETHQERPERAERQSTPNHSGGGRDRSASSGGGGAGYGSSRSTGNVGGPKPSSQPAAGDLLDSGGPEFDDDIPF